MESRTGLSCDFYPRPPRGGRPTPPERNTRDWLISIHALREEGDQRQAGILAQLRQISIHALREEGDRGQQCGQCPYRISIHALREEGDLPLLVCWWAL